MKKEKIISQIPEIVIDKLTEILQCPVKRILVGGNFMISGGGYNPDDFNSISYSGNELSLIFECNGFQVDLSMMTTLSGQEAYGAYDNIHLRTYQNNFEKDIPFVIERRLLIKNRGILNLGLPLDLYITSIDVYGIRVENYRDYDPDFPEEETFIDADIDVLLKFSTNDDFFSSGMLKTV